MCAKGAATDDPAQIGPHPEHPAGLREVVLLWGMENVSEVMRDFTEVTKRF